jgi:hypothetical protein
VYGGKTQAIEQVSMTASPERRQILTLQFLVESRLKWHTGGRGGGDVAAGRKKIGGGLYRI